MTHPTPSSESAEMRYAKAVALVRAENRVGLSFLQRNMKIGYNTAARLLDEMERNGVVSAYDANGLRTVIAEAA